MTGEKHAGERLTRRAFINGAAALAASGALAGSALPSSGVADEAVPTTEHFAGICRCGCAGHCFLDVHVRDGQVVRTTAGEMADPRYNRICAKGLSHVGRIYSSERLRYPMRRIGERGEGKFERITWEEATREIADRYNTYAKESGPASNTFLVGSGNFGSVALKAPARLQAVLGGTLINFSADLETSYGFGNTLGYGGFGTQNEQGDWVNADRFVCWMADPVNSTPQSMHFILDMKEKGGKYVVIDPYFNANAGKADWYVRVNPATDGALAFGALNHLLEMNWQDKEFLRSRTEAPCFIKEDGTYLRASDLGATIVEGEPDPLIVWDEDTDAPLPMNEAKTPSLESRDAVGGIAVKLAYDVIKDIISEYPVSRASELSGVPEDDIRELARMYAQDGKVTTYMMFGTDRYINGHFNYWPVLMLSAFTGNMCKSGCGVGWTYSQGSGYVNPECGDAPVDVDGNPAQGCSPVQLPLLDMEEIVSTGTYAGTDYPVRSITIFQRNVMSTGGDHESLVRWMKDIDFVTVIDMNMNETALYADILLPACHWFEYEDFVGGGGSTPLFMIQDKCCEPMYESKDDYTICKLIAEAAGYGDFFARDASEFLTALLTSPAFESVGITPEVLREKKTVRQFATDNFVSFEDGFGTATGLFPFYHESAFPWYNNGKVQFDISKEQVPYWEPARYADVNSEIRSQGYPYHIFSQHMRMRTHTQWWDVKYTTEHSPEPTVQLNPDDADIEGIVEGDLVRLTSPNGSVVLKAIINPGIPPKELVSGRSFNSFEFLEGHFSALSHSETGQATPDTAVNDVCCYIEKVEA